MRDLYWLVLGVLVVWRITYLLHDEDGPGRFLARLRRRLGNGFWKRLVDCFYCLSLWIAAPLAWVIGESGLEKLLLWPALSAGAILMERLIREPEIPPAQYFEESEVSDGVLRR